MRFFLLAGLLSLPLHAQTPFALKPNDRVVFFGDSITDQRLYTTFAETYVATRYPQAKISFIHSGWGGDTVNGGGGGPIDVRLWRDVIPYNPTLVTIMLGMNDARYRAFDPALFDEYTKGYKHIVAVIKKQLPGTRITLIQPSPYDDVTRAPLFAGGYNQVLRRYSDFLKELAATENLELADLNTPVVAELTKAFQADATAAARLIPDRVHPGPAGHLLMAKALLLDWKAPAIVSSVTIDAKRKVVLEETNTHVSEVRSAGHGISWTQLDEALPMPVNTSDPLTALALKSSNFTEALNRQPLKVQGLSAASYTLQIEDQRIGSFDAAQLASGINLAELPTPMAEQAALVHTLTLHHTGIHNARWRQLQVPLQKHSSPELLDALKALDVLETALVADQRAAAQPKARHFALIPN
ncbi:SGNH/GDSL hydrolase family protein [Bryobacter aggregatus]|uniref:SGNH/GDSL hydrolase family protein n=1 Tax=Bryobacter aggregatus TaxID=360054 RepID=UPI0004E0B3E3|nr:SGNH/GDSL hydrolase family protein [Bryobacter aggregatus]